MVEKAAASLARKSQTMQHDKTFLLQLEDWPMLSLFLLDMVILPTDVMACQALI